MSDLFEAVGNMHMHTYYSDGEAWHDEIAEAAIAAGLDFVIVTDHNVLVKGVEGY
jgi:predicted metal-dependent phosphoesterase TrpH